MVPVAPTLFFFPFFLHPPELFDLDRQQGGSSCLSLEREDSRLMKLDAA